MKKTNLLVAAVIAAASVIVAGLTVLPSSIQEAQANPCSDIGQSNSADFAEEQENEIDCDFENIGQQIIVDIGLD